MLEVEFVKFDSFNQNCIYIVSVFYGIYEIDQPHLAGPFASKRLPVEHTQRGHSLVGLCFKWHLVLETGNKYAGTMPAASPQNLPAQAKFLTSKHPTPYAQAKYTQSPRKLKAPHPENATHELCSYVDHPETARVLLMLSKPLRF